MSDTNKGYIYMESNKNASLQDPYIPDEAMNKDLSGYAKEEDVKLNNAYRDPVTKEEKFGTMPVNPDVVIPLKPNDTYEIPKGYHSGNSIIYAPSSADYSTGDATENDIIKNKVAWVNGERIVGKLDPNANEENATAKESDILIGKTAWVKKKLLTGTMKNNPTTQKTLLAGESYTIPEGYHGGNDKIKAENLDVQTPGDATSDDVVKGKSCWVNGKFITGTEPTFAEKTADGNIIPDTVLEGYSGYAKGIKVEGSCPNKSGMNKEIAAGEEYIIPHGWYDGKTGKVTGKSLSSQTPGNATANDILYTKQAWVNGVLIQGTRRDDSVITKPEVNTYTCMKWLKKQTNIQDLSSPVVFQLPELNWDTISIIHLDLYNAPISGADVGTPVTSMTITNYKSDEKRIYDGKFSVTSEKGTGKITVTILMPNVYAEVIMADYTIIGGTSNSIPFIHNNDNDDGDIIDLD